MDVNSKRSYTMDARARSVEDTRQRIIEALFELALERLFPEISLDDVAAAADVSVKTILRHFGSREGLIDTTVAYAISRVGSELEEPVGDIDAAVRAITDHNERRGDASLRMLAQELSHPQVQRLTELGRDLHRGWVRRVFGPYLDGDDEVFRLLVVATDVYTWRILRRDMRLSRVRTEQHVRVLVRAVLAHVPIGAPS